MGTEGTNAGFSMSCDVFESGLRQRELNLSKTHESCHIRECERRYNSHASRACRVLRLPEFPSHF